MPSLQLLKLTERGCNLLASRRRMLAAVSAVLVASGTVAYMQSCRNRRRLLKTENSANCTTSSETVKSLSLNSAGDQQVHNARQRRKGLGSLRALASVLLSSMGPNGRHYLMALVTTVALRTTMSNRLAKVQGFLFQAAFLRRVPTFLRLILENLLLCFLQSTLYATSKYLTGSLSLHFRKILTELIHEDYFENMVYYKISHVDDRINNPEQRIASDIRKFCSEFSEIIQDDLTAVTDGLTYTWRLCSYASPKYVLWILAYVIGAGASIRVFSPDFRNLMSMEQQLEGNYRQLHSRLRTHVESIAFYGGETREASYINEKFEALVKHLNIVHRDQWWFGIIQDFLLKYLGATVAVVLIIEPFFAGALSLDASTLGRAKMLSNLRYHTSVITSLFQSLGTLSTSSWRLNRLSGFADRIHELMIVSKELRAIGDKSLIQRNSSSKYIYEADYIEFSCVKIVTPTGNVLVDDLSLQVDSGSNLLITGPNGCGKSSIFRVLGGLWPLISGYLVKPGIGSGLNKEIFYVPQRPYTVVGTLRDQLIYPLTTDQETEPLTYDGMVELLKNVDLEYLLDHYPLDEEMNWEDELSLGEQQRLGMARLFYHKPKFAILDECTSAVTTKMEERFCEKVRAMGTSCITISHRPALVAFHDMILALDGEGGWRVQYKRDALSHPYKTKHDLQKLSGTICLDYACAVHRTSTSGEENMLLTSNGHSYSSKVIAFSPEIDKEDPLPSVPQLEKPLKVLPHRVSSMFKVLVPSPFDKQAMRLLAAALIIGSRTWISDRIASLNGTTVKYVLEQDKSAFIRLVGVSVLQSAANSLLAPTLRHLTVRLALGWRICLTQHLLKNYLKGNAFYKVFQMSSKHIDADQRITQDVEKLASDLSGLVTGMVKPCVDILWFTWRMKLLSGWRGVTILYAYMILGLGFLRGIAPEFGALSSREQQLDGAFRYMHARLRTHAESIAFFGGGSREKVMIDSGFREFLQHRKIRLRMKCLYAIVDDFITKQLPHNVTWILSLLYALEHKADQALASTQGELAHAMRFLASVVSQSFLAFGDIIELHKKYLELSGGINRIFELDELLEAAQSDVLLSDACVCSEENEMASQDIVTFCKVDIVTPSQKLLAKQMTCDVVPGKSLLVTGPNGSGKTSIFRILRGLWPIGSGRLMKPCHSVFYVPQRPYTCPGTLRDQIIYPFSHDEAKLRMTTMVRTGHNFLLDDHLTVILERVRLVYLLEREGWDAIANWEEVLSLGEQQRLGVARLFFHHPKFGILDECTNAISVDVEEHLYHLAKEMGITVITSSQRPALVPYHAMELTLVDGRGKWVLCELSQ
ncbi:ABC transporter D family member 1-like isoform X2 [Zingiber officinale]|uniref:ABC transporter D family member 1-like isoform X2 n=1 Tax=Zingiber officinale TaxID=94328 RepID=UPI001C4DBB6E|nr:ABC transporter D family member 1-like isoform X2 [Zingiber officinale]